MIPGAQRIGGGACTFAVWAPFADRVDVKIVSPREYVIPMARDDRGYWTVTSEDIKPGTSYYYRLNNEKDRPDPASRYQPQGVHGPSAVVDHTAASWTDADWKGIPLSEMIMYELHVGTFTPEGTFEAMIPRLSELNETGINAIELMPVAQFPGERNWGYDGTFPYAVQNSYGGPTGLKTLVNACHRRGIAVILDVVYNHLGPEGNYLVDFGPYFTDKYRTPWGMALNFDDAYSNEVREFFIQNALSWFRDFHIDALRLDAIHGMTDFSAKPLLQELAERVDDFSAAVGSQRYLIAESDLNDARVIRQREQGGYGLHAQWCDDYHHALHTLLTKEANGYYVDFGKTEHLVTSLREGFVYSGSYSTYRRRNQGNSSKDRPAEQFVVFSQNHDQIGNRMFGDRLSSVVSFEALKLAAGAVLLSPSVPLLFMGEEYGEDAPFLYFVSHSDHDLVDAVRKGRAAEFTSFKWKGDPPDPQSEATFERAKLAWEKRTEGHRAVLLAFYTHLIDLRREHSSLSHPDRNTLEAAGKEREKIISLRRGKGSSELMMIMNFSDEEQGFDLPARNDTWTLLLDSADARWRGPGSALPASVRGGDRILIKEKSLALYLKEDSR